MTVSGISNSAFTPWLSVNRNPGTTTALGSGTEDDIGTPQASTQNYDFSDMTPKQMLATVNNLIKNGKMTVDESSSLVGLMPIPDALRIANHESPRDESNTPVDFISRLKQEISYDQYSHNASGVGYGDKALDALSRIMGVDISA
jgi:hypothetical protein